LIRVSDKPGGDTLILGDVVRFHIQDDIIAGFRTDPNKLKPLGRMGGPTYAGRSTGLTCRVRFESADHPLRRRSRIFCPRLQA
jgi:flavin reductase (DIM6/NTAB) family NADH-FMN oxidoreductase RutF